MEIGGRRMRRFVIRRDSRQTNTLLPMQASASRNLSKTISCWYCDYKISALNKPLFFFGRRRSKFLKVWFSVGVGFALSALLGVTLILLLGLARVLHLCNGNNKLGSLMHDLFFGFPSLVGDYLFQLQVQDLITFLLGDNYKTEDIIKITNEI